MDLALNNLQRLISHKTETIYQPTSQSKFLMQEDSGLSVQL